ncbi:MAG: FABP family protein [Sphingomonadales bacterium 32-68-7]|nr:MAG: FABP family protein [Sphingomonadales bacterium 12-68-11]OYX08141.1 MAG: FABP family protein [Sphingomonadales bacterium 32-68-7]
MDVPDDIFTEPEDVDPDTLRNLGPLRGLAGTWEGLHGVDVAPKAGGPEQRRYFERIVFEPIDHQANGPQLFYGLRYHQHVNTREEDVTFHDQVGYWLYEPATGLILQSLTIPRGQCALAAGHAEPDARKLTLKAERGHTDYGICSTGFLEQAFTTQSYTIEVTFHADGSWSYLQDTMLKVRGQDALFRHRDHSRLKRVAEPAPNPLARIVGAAPSA